MIELERHRLLLARRTFLGRSALGLGSLALASLLEPRLLSSTRADTGADGRPKLPHYQGVIHPRHLAVPGTGRPLLHHLRRPLRSRPRDATPSHTLSRTARSSVAARGALQQ